MIDWEFVAFIVTFGILMVPLGLFYLENAIIDNKFDSDLAYLNAYMPYFSYAMSSLFIGGYLGLLTFVYKDKHRCVKQNLRGDKQ